MPIGNSGGWSMRSNIDFIKHLGQIRYGSVTVSVHFKVNVSKRHHVY